MDKKEKIYSEMIMNESDIKKAIECCRIGNCNDCPCESVNDCLDELPKATLDYIRTLEAENEKLNKQVNELTVTLSNFAKATRAETIKDFAERLKENTLPLIIGGKYEFNVITRQGIDHYAKEMVGEK